MNLGNVWHALHYYDVKGRYGVKFLYIQSVQTMYDRIKQSPERKEKRRKFDRAKARAKRVIKEGK